MSNTSRGSSKNSLKDIEALKTKVAEIEALVFSMGAALTELDMVLRVTINELEERKRLDTENK